MAATRVHLFILTDGFLLLEGLRSKETLAYQNAATVTATVYNSANQPVTGLQNISLSYVALSNGNYRGAIDDALVPANLAGSRYTIELVAVQSGVKHTWRNPLTIEYDALPVA